MDIQGLDVSKLSSSNRFAFIDDLTNLAASKADSGVTRIEQAITRAIQALSFQDRKITLILDQPDTLLATGTATSQHLNHLLLTLRSKVHSAVLTLSADLPFVSASTQSLAGHEQSQPTPLETETAAFLVQQAHAAKFIIGVRELETGAAKDVSGVLRVTRGGDADGGDESGGEEVKEMEALFLVGRDGGVKVFERGSAG